MCVCVCVCACVLGGVHVGIGDGRGFLLQVGPDSQSVVTGWVTGAGIFYNGLKSTLQTQLKADTKYSSK